jgi:quinol monooxygenase YgiN
MSVILKGQLICTTEAEAARVRALLPEHIRLTRAEPGCLRFDVTPAGLLTWQVDEEFAGRAAFDAHQTRTRASAWFRQTDGIRRAFTLTGG